MHIITIVIIFLLVSIILIITYGPEQFPFYSWYSTKETEYEKLQWVRLLDIFVLGPGSIWLGYKLQTDTKSWGIWPYILYINGFGTIIYNFINYYKNIYG